MTSTARSHAGNFFRSSTPAARNGIDGLGVVVIGRNEGERLRRCLASVATSSHLVVYVDSGSTDGSVTLAESQGVVVVKLDMSVPFTAARARNAGFRCLRDIAPQATLVQFIDGDCELIDSWMGAAAPFLDEHRDVACVCGRLHERFPDRSIYNRLCDAEWDRAEGETDACGGIAMMKTSAFEAVGGFNEGLIAGEEPELCIRIRAQGGRIWRIANDMALHDADMHRFSQWWRRAMRGGYAAAEGTVMYGTDPTTKYARRLGKLAFWAAGVPIAILALAAFNPWFLLAAAAYPLQIARLALRRGRIGRNAWIEASFQVLAYFAEGAGAARYLSDKIRSRQGKLIEYR